jgi:hypothetical protein
MKNIEIIITFLVLILCATWIMNSLPTQIRLTEDSFPVFNEFIDKDNSGETIDCEKLINTIDSFTFINGNKHKNPLETNVFEFEKITKQKLPFCQSEILELRIKKICNPDFINGLVNDFILPEKSEELINKEFSIRIQSRQPIYECDSYLDTAIDKLTNNIKINQKTIKIDRLDKLILISSIGSIDKTKEKFIGTDYFIINIKTTSGPTRLVYGKEQDADDAMNLLTSLVSK